MPFASVTDPDPTPIGDTVRLLKTDERKRKTSLVKYFLPKKLFFPQNLLTRKKFSKLLTFYKFHFSSN